MKDRIPRPHELAIFAAMAVVCTVVVHLMGKYDIGLAVMGMPIFFVSALMGLRRSGELAAPGRDSDPTDPAC